jgi:hypothetical protein
MLHAMTRQEMWRQQYLLRRYLEHSTAPDIAARLRYLIENVTTLLPNGIVGFLPPEPEGKHWYELVTHVQEEYRKRGAEPPEGFLKGALVPNPTSPVARAAIRAIRATTVPAEGTYLVKLGKREHMLDFYKRGRLRIAPASSYADPSLNPAVQDDELSFSSYGLQSEVLIQVFDHKTGHLKASTKPIGNMTYTSRSKTDYYVYCMCLSLDYRLFGDFRYNAAVVVRDPAAFEDRLSKAVAAFLPDWIGGAGPVRYVDPFNCKKDDIDIYFIKHHRYWYQREYRCSWIPRKDPAAPLKPFFVELGPLRDICRLVALDCA